MKLKEFIEKLSQYPEDSEIVACFPGYYDHDCKRMTDEEINRIFEHETHVKIDKQWVDGDFVIVQHLKGSDY